MTPGPGPGATGAGRPGVVLLHGLGGGPETWAALSALLAPAWSVVAPRIGATDGSMRFELARAVSIARKALERLSGRPHVLVGHSLGVVAAVETALAHPGLVDHLVLVSGFLRSPRWQALQRVVMVTTPSRSYARSGRDKQAVTGPMRDLRGYDRTAEGACLEIPVPVVCGDRDIVNLRGSRRAADVFPDARLVVLPGVGHLVPVEAPGVLAGVISDTLA